MGKFYRPGYSKIKFLPAVAGSSPTRNEINAGVDISARVAEISDFTVEGNLKETPDFGSAFVSKVAAEDTIGEPSMTLWDDNVDTVLRTTLAKGASGFIVLEPYGDVASKRCEVWPIVSTGFNDQWARDDIAQAMVKFSVPSPPNQSATVPA